MIKSRKPKTLICSCFLYTAKYVVQFVLWMISLQVMQLYLWTSKICPQTLQIDSIICFFLSFMTLKYGADIPYWMFTWYLSLTPSLYQFSLACTDSKKHLLISCHNALVNKGNALWQDFSSDIPKRVRIFVFFYMHYAPTYVPT